MGAERFLLYGVLLGLLIYNAYFHFSAENAALKKITEATTQEGLLYSLPDGVTATDACKTLQHKFHIDSRDALSKGSVSLQHHWTKLGCDSLTTLGATSSPAIDQRTPATIGASSSSSSKSSDSGSVVATTESPTEPPPIGGTTQAFKAALAAAGVDGDSPVNLDAMVKNRCKKLKDKFGVQPGQSWGSMPLDMQKRWAKLGCDVMLVAAVSNQAAESKGSGGGGATGRPAGTGAVPVPVPTLSGGATGGVHTTKPSDGAKSTLGEGTAADVLRISKLTTKDADYWTAPVISKHGMPSFNLQHKDWCVQTMQKYSVVPMKSWGNLPEGDIPRWKGSKCDLVFTERRFALKPLPSCTEQDHGTGRKPIIAIMAATTTRKVQQPSTKTIALFIFLLPSLIRTLDCGYTYVYVMGYDIGDPFYDTNAGMAEVKQWFKENVQDPLAANGIAISLRPVRVNNTFKKPGPVFNEMARAAYTDGADYFYRVNDDTELVGDWAKQFVTTVHKFTPPVAIVGPTCQQGNQHILTHDFVHRSHMEIFEMNYYPPDLKDWWMDDWISLVYGRKRTFKARQAEVIHHVKHHGMRYEVDRANEHRVTSLVALGRKQIHKWMVKSGYPQSEVSAFDGDIHGGVYDGKYEFSSV